MPSKLSKRKYSIDLINSLDDPRYSQAINLIEKNYQGERQYYIEQRELIDEWFDYYFDKPEKRECKELLFVLEDEGKVICSSWNSYYPNLQMDFLNQIESEEESDLSFQNLFIEIEKYLKEQKCEYIITELISLDECNIYENVGFKLLFDDSIYSIISAKDGNSRNVFLMVKNLTEKEITKNAILRVIRFVSKVYNDCWADLNDNRLYEKQNSLTKNMIDIVHDTDYVQQLLSLKDYLDIKNEYGNLLEKLRYKKIFISYSSKDRKFVQRFVKDLRSIGFGVWVDYWELKIGDSLIEKIPTGIKESGWVVVILSKNSIKSNWVRKELSISLTKEINLGKVFVLPIVIEDCNIPFSLVDKLYANFKDDYKKGFESLKRTLTSESEID